MFKNTYTNQLIIGTPDARNDQKKNCLVYIYLPRIEKSDFANFFPQLVRYHPVPHHCPLHPEQCRIQLNRGVIIRDLSTLLSELANKPISFSSCPTHGAVCRR